MLGTFLAFHPHGILIGLRSGPVSAPHLRWKWQLVFGRFRRICILERYFSDPCFFRFCVFAFWGKESGAKQVSRRAGAPLGVLSVSFRACADVHLLWNVVMFWFLWRRNIWLAPFPSSLLTEWRSLDFRVRSRGGKYGARWFFCVEVSSSSPICFRMDLVVWIHVSSSPSVSLFWGICVACLVEESFFALVGVSALGFVEFFGTCGRRFRGCLLFDSAHFWAVLDSSGAKAAGKLLF